MKNIVILGCENSHAENFLSVIRDNPDLYSDYNVVGVFSEEKEAMENLSKNFGVPMMESFDEAKGRVDGVLITARRGDNHYKYAKPYIESGVPMFIDKPVTSDTDEAIEFMRSLCKFAVRISGGSSLSHADEIISLAEDVKNLTDGETLGGIVRAPLSLDSPYGGFWFYAQHLVEMLVTVFGRYPKSLRAYRNGSEITVIFRYAEYDITGVYTDHSYRYFAARFSKKGSQGGAIPFTNEMFSREFADFDALMRGEEQKISYKDFIAPVFIMKAIEKSLESGEEEQIESYEV